MTLDVAWVHVPRNVFVFKHVKYICLRIISEPSWPQARTQRSKTMTKPQNCTRLIQSCISNPWMSLNGQNISDGLESGQLGRMQKPRLCVYYIYILIGTPLKFWTEQIFILKIKLWFPFLGSLAISALELSRPSAHLLSEWFCLGLYSNIALSFSGNHASGKTICHHYLRPVKNATATNADGPFEKSTAETFV